MAGFDPTLGGSAATSYISVVEADAILLNTRYNPTWQGNTEADKSKYLNAATLWLETLDYVGTRCNPSRDNANLPQALKWPRSGATCDGVEATCSFIPRDIQYATAILAATLTANPDAITGPIGGGGSAPAGTYIKRQKIDVLEVEYDQFVENQYNDDCSDCSLPAILQEFPWLKDLLGCWLGNVSTTGNRLIRLYRN